MTIKHCFTPKDNQPNHNLIDDFYVDNVITGANNMEKALQLYSKAKKLFLDISMNLRDWNSNSPELKRKIDRMKDPMEKTITKVLGLQWDTITNQLIVNTKIFNNSMTATTKRQVLTTIASLFDPLRYLTPAIVKMRLFLQNLWIQGKGWGDHLKNEDIQT